MPLIQPDRRRADTVREILEGTQNDESRACSLLGYPLSRRHTAPADISWDEVLAGGVRLAVGEPARGIAGFRQTHREAMAAQRIAEADRRAPACTRYRDVELVAQQQLRATLQAFLDCHGNQEATARRLQVHKNTVRYRLQRLQELLDGDPYTDWTSLDLAMQCINSYGLPVG